MVMLSQKKRLLSLFLFILYLFLFSKKNNLSTETNAITKNIRTPKIYGNGQHGTARWSSKKEVLKKIFHKKNKEEKWVENIVLNEALKGLSERERKIIDMRFFNGKTQMEISDELGISQAQVSRIEKNALNNVKKLIK